MTHLRSPQRLLAALAALAAVVLAMAGCSKKLTSVDSSYTAPEGRPSADARLIVYPDLPVTIQTWYIYEPYEEPGPMDWHVTSDVHYFTPGTIHGVIMDGTAASGYQVLRREANGGYLRLKDFVLHPVFRFLDSQWESYAFADSRPAGFRPPTYLGRGVVAGQITPASPLTNAAELAMSDVADLHYASNPVYREPADSNITMKWEPVEGAAGYWMQVYQFKGGKLAKWYSSQPAPFVISDVRNYFVGFVPAPADSHKIGLPGALVLTQRPLLTGGEYLVRVAAVDARGEMIAVTHGDLPEEYLALPDSVPPVVVVEGDTLQPPSIRRRQRHDLGAIKVTPKRATVAQ
jgi:hypothetical protein